MFEAGINILMLHDHIYTNHMSPLNFRTLNAGFFFDRAKKLKDEKTQNSSKKLKDSVNFGVTYRKNQLK